MTPIDPRHACTVRYPVGPAPAGSTERYTYRTCDRRLRGRHPFCREHWEMLRRSAGGLATRVSTLTSKDRWSVAAETAIRQARGHLDVLERLAYEGRWRS